MKLRSFYKDNIYIITQSNHGVQQALRAFDFGYLGYSDKHLYGVADMQFKREWGSGVDGGCEYWIRNTNAYVQFVHITALNKGSVAPGQQFAIATGDHGHITANLDGSWTVYLDVADRSATLYWWQFGGKKDPWTNWNTYSDRQIPLIVNNNDMATLQNPLKLQSTNTLPLNVRATPDTNSTIIGKMAPNTLWESNLVSGGSVVNGNSTWYGYQAGWVSGAYVKELPVDCSVVEAELKAANQTIAEQKVVIVNQKAEIESFKPANLYSKS